MSNLQIILLMFAVAIATFKLYSISVSRELARLDADYNRVSIELKALEKKTLEEPRNYAIPIRPMGNSTKTPEVKETKVIIPEMRDRIIDPILNHDIIYRPIKKYDFMEDLKSISYPTKNGYVVSKRSVAKLMEKSDRINDDKIFMNCYMYISQRIYLTQRGINYIDKHCLSVDNNIRDNVLVIKFYDELPAIKQHDETKIIALPIKRSA